MAVWGGLTNSCEKKRSKKQRRKGISDQGKEIEENNRMGKTRDLFKKIRDTKGTFHAKMGLIKDRNGMDLTEAEDIKKRYQGNISCKDGLDKGQKWYGPNRSRRY